MFFFFCLVFLSFVSFRDTHLVLEFIYLVSLTFVNYCALIIDCLHYFNTCCISVNRLIDVSLTPLTLAIHTLGIAHVVRIKYSHRPPAAVGFGMLV